VHKFQNVRVHFVGIGGIGMSGIAEVLLSFGCQVSGSDLSNSSIVERLRSRGADIAIGHHGDNVKDATVMVYSSAVSEENPEMVAAKERKIPIMKRAEMLAELMRLKSGIAIAGTHGKTTTTSILTTILRESDRDPTYIIGGIVKNLEGNAQVGKGEFLIAEADESDGTFLHLSPIFSVVTNIDSDHLDFYGTEQRIFEAFKRFANQVPFYGLCSLNAHDEKLMDIKRDLRKPSVTFGIGDKVGPVDYGAMNIVYGIESSEFDLHYQGSFVIKVKLNLLGEHNVLNCLGAISIAHSLGLDFEQIASGVSCFKGVGRRMELLYKNKDFVLIDDYAHHPTEITSTLASLKENANKKIVTIFEPHRFTRTKDCWDQFLHCFNQCDELYLRPIYPASESPLPGITSDRLSSDINQLHPNFSEVIEKDEDLFKMIASRLDEDAVVVTLGAGKIGKDIRKWVAEQK
jgi:UDP-N-acetylmuramate--alanine ligase